MPWVKDAQKCPDKNYDMYCDQYQAKPAMKKKCFRNDFVTEYVNAMTDSLSAEQKQQVLEQWDMCNMTDKLEAFRLHYDDLYKREKADDEVDTTKYLKKNESSKPVSATALAATATATPYVPANKRVELLQARAKKLISDSIANNKKQRQNDIKRLTQRGVPKLTQADLASNDPDINIFPERLSLSLGRKGKRKSQKLHSLPTKKELRAMSVSSLFKRAPVHAPATSPAHAPVHAPSAHASPVHASPAHAQPSYSRWLLRRLLPYSN